MAYINGNDVLLHVGGGNEIKTCTVNISTRKTSIRYIAASVLQDGEITALVVNTEGTIENVICGSVLYVCANAGDEVNGATQLNEYNGNFCIKVPTETETVEIEIRGN